MWIHGGRTDDVSVMAPNAAITLTSSVRPPCIHIEPSVLFQLSTGCGSLMMVSL